jgi:hypothetical protein
MRTEFGRAAGANSLTSMNGMRRRRTTAPIACVLLIALFQVRVIVIINPKVPGSRPGRPTTPTARHGVTRPLHWSIGSSYRAGTATGGGGPTYRADGRISRLCAACSITCVVQPMVRPAAKVGVNMWRGMPQMYITTPA